MHSARAHNHSVLTTDLTAETLIADDQGALYARTTQAA